MAIQGHSTRGNEVIKLLEMMGGYCSAEIYGLCENRCYSIKDNGWVGWDYIGPEEIEKYVIFTLEEFLEKYPFKVGDKVIDTTDGCPGVVNEMKWDEDVSDMKYRVAFDNGDMAWYTNDTIDWAFEFKGRKTMSKKLAIKGHPSRNNEVINLLEMTGGRNENNMFLGKDLSCIYYIDGYGFIRKVIIENNIHTMRHWQIFTLEEFLEKYPFKVGDFVRIPEYESEVRICKMKWCPLSEHIEYLVYRNDDEEWYTADELLEYNDNPMDCCTNNMIKLLDDVYSITKCKTTGQGTYAIKIAEGYKFDSIDENGNIIVKSIKPKYPTTYDECCEMLNADEFVGYELMTNFPKLINARNAYWKIAGEEMGLGKPWEPDWDEETNKFTISNKCNKIYLNNTAWYAEVLSFPTEEMRDAFYENFKDLIEQCKEFL